MVHVCVCVCVCVCVYTCVRLCGVFIYIPASAAVTVWRRRTIDDVLTDGEERLLQHISQQLTREMHVARSHHSHVSVITVGGGRDVLGGRSPVHVRHPKPTRHHEGYASGPMLDGSGHRIRRPDVRDVSGKVSGLLKTRNRLFSLGET